MKGSKSKASKQVRFAHVVKHKQKGAGQTISSMKHHAGGYERMPSTKPKPQSTTVTYVLPPGHTPFSWMHAPYPYNMPAAPPAAPAKSGNSASKHQTVYRSRML
jgi:hypothetical protein